MGQRGPKRRLAPEMIDLRSGTVSRPTEAMRQAVG